MCLTKSQVQGYGQCANKFLYFGAYNQRSVWKLDCGCIIARATPVRSTAETDIDSLSN